MQWTRKNCGHCSSVVGWWRWGTKRKQKVVQRLAFKEESMFSYEMTVGITRKWARNYRNDLRMDRETFNLLLSLVKNKIMNHMLSVKFVGAPTACSNLFNPPVIRQILWKLHTAILFDRLVQLVVQQCHKRYDYRLYSRSSCRCTRSCTIYCYVYGLFYIILRLTLPHITL